MKQFERLDGETAVVQGEILEVEYSDGATELLLRVKEHSLEQAPSSFSLLVTGIEKEFYEVGDLFKTQVTLQSVSSHNSFSRTLHLRARGVFLTALLDSPVEIRENPSPSIQSQVTRISETLSSSLRRLLPGEPGALTAAIALGDRENLSEESVDGFQLCGVSHLLALSGLHLSLLCGVVLLGLERFAIHRKICYTVLILVVLLYMGLTGFGFSILRAGVMQILSYIAMICYRKADPLTSLGFAAGTICLFQPYAAGDVGLLLSVATTAAIIVFPGGWQRSFLACCEQKRGLFRFSALRKGLSRLVPSLFVSFAAAIASFPVSVICFESFSLAGPFATLVYAPFLPVIMLGGLAAAIFQTLGLSFLAVPFALIAKWCAQLLLWCTEKLSGIPFVSLFLGEPYVVCWTVLVLAGGVLFLFFYRRGLSRFLAGSLSVLLTAAIVCQLYTMDVVKVRLVQGREENGVVVSLHGQALYFGSVSSGSDLYDLELALKQDHLSGACVLRPVKTSAADKWNVFLKNAAPEWTACLAGQDTGSLRWEPDYLLAEGDFMFSDQSRLEIRKVGEGYACLLRLQRMEILILTGGGDARGFAGWLDETGAFDLSGVY